MQKTSKINIVLAIVLILIGCYLIGVSTKTDNVHYVGNTCKPEIIDNTVPCECEECIEPSYEWCIERYKESREFINTIRVS